MKTRVAGSENGSKAGRESRAADPVKDPADAARVAQVAIQENPSLPENYAVLAGALRTLAKSLRERNAEGADRLLHLACAVAWEAKRKSGQGLTSGRTKQEVKVLIAWLRTKNHLAPEAAENLMDQIHSEYLGLALEETGVRQLLAL